MSQNRRNTSDRATSALAAAMIALIAMPIFGIYLLTRNNEKDRSWGIVLTVLGIILWIAVLIMSAWSIIFFKNICLWLS